MIEAEFYCISEYIIEANKMQRDNDNSFEWKSNIIFIGINNLDNTENNLNNRDYIQALNDNNIHCPDNTELVWKSIHDPGLTVIFQICQTDDSNQKSDFKLKNIGILLEKLNEWERHNLRFVLVYDAELIRELFKLSRKKFTNSSYVWYFSYGRLIECSLQWKLKYVGENMWKHYYLTQQKINNSPYFSV